MAADTDWISGIGFRDFGWSDAFPENFRARGSREDVSPFRALHSFGAFAQASARVGQLPFADKPVVQGVGPNPEPHHTVFMFHGKCPIMQAGSNGPESPDPFEVEGRMLRIPPQQLIGLVGQAAYVFRKLAVAVPESPIGAVPHRSVQRPARRSSSASSPRASRRPAATSSSIRRSHASASCSANHARNAANSDAESRRTASSISFTLPILSSLLCAVALTQLHHRRGLYSCTDRSSRYNSQIVRRSEIGPKRQSGKRAGMPAPL